MASFVDPSQLDLTNGSGVSTDTTYPGGSEIHSAEAYTQLSMPGDGQTIWMPHNFMNIASNGIPIIGTLAALGSLHELRESGVHVSRDSSESYEHSAYVALSVSVLHLFNVNPDIFLSVAIQPANLRALHEGPAYGFYAGQIMLENRLNEHLGSMHTMDDIMRALLLAISTQHQQLTEEWVALQLGVLELDTETKLCNARLYEASQGLLPAMRTLTVWVFCEKKKTVLEESYTDCFGFTKPQGAVAQPAAATPAPSSTTPGPTAATPSQARGTKRPRSASPTGTTSTNSSDSTEPNPKRHTASHHRNLHIPLPAHLTATDLLHAHAGSLYYTNLLRVALYHTNQAILAAVNAHHAARGEEAAVLKSVSTMSKRISTAVHDAADAAGVPREVFMLAWEEKRRANGVFVKGRTGIAGERVGTGMQGWEGVCGRVLDGLDVGRGGDEGSGKEVAVLDDAVLDDAIMDDVAGVGANGGLGEVGELNVEESFDHELLIQLQQAMGYDESMLDPALRG